MADTYQLFSAMTQADPYSVYARLLAEVPFYKDSEHSWTISSYSGVMAVLLDPRSSSVRATMEGPPPDELAQCRPLADVNQAMILFLDPPSHTRLRGLVAQAFSAKMIEGLRPRIQELVDDILDRVAGMERWNVMAELADPLPSLVIAELLGVPTTDAELIKAWSNAYAMWLGTTNEEDERHWRPIANAAIDEMTTYVRAQAAERRRDPRGDLLTALVQAEDAGDKLSERELVATCVLLLFAGNETTTNLIGNGLLTLLRHPDELRRLRDNPALIRPAIEELLRYEGPVQMTARRASAPFEIEGHQIAAGDWLNVILGAANRDPSVFPDPHRLDIGRRPNRHLTFAHGAHFCLGAPLARAEGQIAILSAVQRFPNLRLVDERLMWRNNPVLRGLTSLWVA